MLERIPRKPSGPIPNVLGSAWILVGALIVMATLAIDEQVQRLLTDVGLLPYVRHVTGWWQELGATSGIVGFLILILGFARDVAKPSILGLAATGCAAQFIKHLVGRVRPDSSADATIFYGPFGHFSPGPHFPTDSFPSGHTAAAFAMAYALSQRWPKATWCWYVLAAGVGLSRTLRHVHFPSDVIFGAILGTLICQGVFRWTCRRNLTEIAQSA